MSRPGERIDRCPLGDADVPNEDVPSADLPDAGLCRPGHRSACRQRSSWRPESPVKLPVLALHVRFAFSISGVGGLIHNRTLVSVDVAGMRAALASHADPPGKTDPLDEEWDP
jgi:hypothetical protein